MSNDLSKEEQLRAKNRERIAGFRLMDDTFMNAFFNDRPELVQFVLRIIMKKSDLVVTSAKTQKALKNIQGRSIALDIDAVDKNGTEYDIEIQQEDSGADPKRARYHSSMLDSNALKPREDFDKLRETYVIFITSSDYFGAGLPLYTVNRYIEELQKPFNDRAHIIYVNGEYRDNSDIGKLMHDFKCSEPSKMYYGNLAERADYFKSTEGGNKDMCKIMEESNQEYAKLQMYQVAEELIKMGDLSEEKIAKATKLTIEEVREIAKNAKESA